MIGPNTSHSKPATATSKVIVDPESETELDLDTDYQIDSRGDLVRVTPGTSADRFARNSMSAAAVVFLIMVLGPIALFCLFMFIGFIAMMVS